MGGVCTVIFVSNPTVVLCCVGVGALHKSNCILIITTLYMYEGGSDKPYVVLRLCFCGVGGGQEWG